MVDRFSVNFQGMLNARTAWPKKEPLAGIVSGSKVIFSRRGLGDTP
jgi:hypothetical protein